VHPATGLLFAYLLGSIPAAYIAGKAIKGVDLRQVGSGNLGATNVYRTLGWKVALVVLLFDAAKGAIPVLFFPDWLKAHPAEHWAIAYGIAAIAGHVRPIFLLMKGGGKGVATAAGVFLALAPAEMGIAVAVWLAVVLVSGYVSLGSLVAAAVLAILLVIMEGFRSPVAIVGLVLAAFVFFTHRANIGRLRRGEEHRFGKKKAAT
jgi:acyl phosphate:glycerol-3-phosphate acyltransferase